MTEAIKLLASKNIVHRDIKPENIMISEFDPDNLVIKVKLSDFGLMKNEESLHSTMSGTKYYMAPEVLKYGKCSTFSDIYALGATLYHLMSKVPLEV